ncbi:NADP-dependent oxidoreductase [Nocardia sp. NPDC057668]|uniref:NADP-dependent oxidoreductase n=1 Tax=Nocardia sp. NPDC057668 TaxID=3346202 RepID=UPI00366D9934
MSTQPAPATPVVTMRAARIHDYGAPDVIADDVVPVPHPVPGEVLIRVAATSFNPSEAALRSGALRHVLPLPLPYTLGWDVAGIVTEVGPGVTMFGPGDRVIARLDTGGAAAEYVAAAADLLAPAPAGLPLTDAAAIPVAALTAWQAVHEHAEVSPGQRVLINGAGGGVGGFAVQLAKRAGARVLATASARSAAAIRELGADRTIDYTAQPLPADLDAVINLAALTPGAASALTPLIRPGGRLVSIATPIPAPDAVHFVTRNDAAQLARISALVGSKHLRVDIAESRPLRDLPEIHRRSEAGLTRGKIILHP